MNENTILEAKNIIEKLLIYAIALKTGYALNDDVLNKTIESAENFVKEN